MSKSQHAGLWMRFIKKELDMRRFKHNEVNFEVTFEVQQHHSKIYFMSILRGIDDYHMSHFAYACKMRCPLNLVLEKSEYLWFY